MDEKILADVLLSEDEIAQGKEIRGDLRAILIELDENV